MPDPAPDGLPDEPGRDLPPPEPAPAGWAPPTPVEKPAEAPQVEIELEQREALPAPPSKTRRFWTTTIVYVVLALASNAIISAGQPIWLPLIFLLPLYLLVLPFVLRTPKRFRGQKAKLVDRLDWQGKLMTSVVVFLIIYLPFAFFSNLVIPFASLVEYCLFALLLLILLRLGGRSAGVAPSLDALPPPNHRLHRQVIGSIDDAHYQRTLWLNYSFVEKGRGAKTLAKRVDEILESNGINPDRRAQVLGELHQYEDGGRFGRRSRDVAERDRRVQVLERLFATVGQELEHRA